MRKAIWKHFEGELNLQLVDLDVSEGEDTKKIWAKIATILPVYFLFQSDRSNTDGDKEVQDPLKMAVAQFLQDTEIQTTLNNIAEQVEEKLREIANTLKPVIPSASNLKWADVFKSVSITADDDIPINKRGSGVKRLILLNFFRAEAERRMSLCDGTGVIYAIEAPETSQHFSNQKILAEALI